MAAENVNTMMSIKLLVDKTKSVVVFAEAGKDFVDFIFHILALPMATVTRLLTKNAMVGSLGNIYGSFQTLERSYLEISKKSTLLKPKTPIYGGSSFEPHATNSADSNTYYRCRGSASDCRNYISGIASAICPQCNKPMKGKVKMVKGDGYVKDVVTYMVMDSLVVKPLSTISSTIDLLKQSNVKDLIVLEEMTVEFGFEQCIQLLETSLKSTTVLTDIFLRETSSLRSVGQNRMEEDEDGDGEVEVEEAEEQDDDDEEEDDDDNLSDDYYSDDDDFY